MFNKSLPLLLTVVSIIIPVILYYVTATNKELTYEVISNSDIIDINKEIDDIKISIGTQRVDSVSLMNLRIKNTGSEPIRSADFEGPIIIGFNKNPKVLRANVMNQVPDSLPVSINNFDKKLEIPPLLLNTEDRFDIEILRSDELIPSVDARIVGIKEITKVINKPTNSRSNYLSFLCASFLVALYGRSASKFILERQFKVNHALTGLVSMLSAALLLREQTGQFKILDDEFLLMGFIICFVSIGMLPTIINRFSTNKIKVY